jgi:hypothetical protein
MQFGPSAQEQNIVFSNLVLQDVTGPISINLNNRARQGAAVAASQPKGFLRNIAFRGIRGNVVSEGREFDDIAFKQNYRPGETRQCIVLNGIGDAFMNEIVFDDVRLTYGGGGTTDEAQREVAQVAGEYFEVGTPPAYGLFARNVRGLTLNNVRFDVEKPDLRPAVVLDHVTDAAISGLAAQGNPQAKSVLRFVETRDVLLTASRVLTPAAAFLQVEGAASQGITIDGGDISKAATPLALAAGAAKESVKLRG